MTALRLSLGAGDKGGCANVGVWANSEEAATFLFQYLTVEQLKKLLPDTRPYKVERYQLGNLKALNFFIHDILGDGVSSNSRYMIGLLLLCLLCLEPRESALQNK